MYAASMADRRLSGRRSIPPSLILFLCLFAGQAGVLVLSPILRDVAEEFGVSTATAGQLRSVSGLVAGLAAILMARLARRLGLRDMLTVGLAFLGSGSLLSALAPSFVVLAVAQGAVGLGLAVVLSVGVAAAGEWAEPDDRPRVLAWTLMGPAASWVVGMPLIALVAGNEWRYAWLAVPFAASLIAFAALRTRPADRAVGSGGSGWGVLRNAEVAAWGAGELLAFSAWAGTLVYSGALFVESYGSSTASTAVFLAVGALFYLPGNYLARWWVERAARVLLIGCALGAAAMVALFGWVRPGPITSLIFFCVLSFFAGARTLAGSAFGMHSAPEHKVGVMSVRTAALQFGYFVGAAVAGAALASAGYVGVGLALSGLFLLAVLPHAAMIVFGRHQRVDITATSPLPPI
jgi:DHA1 family inner membrane transport protein